MKKNCEPKLNITLALLAVQSDIRALHVRIDDLLERLDRKRDRLGRYKGPGCPAEGGKRERIGMEGRWE